MKNNKTFLAVALSCALVSPQLSAQTAVGAYVDNDAWVVDNIDQFNVDTARNATTVNVFTTFDNDWDSLSVQAGNVVSREAVPLITLMPYSKNNPDSNILQEIIDGRQDAYIDAWIEGYRAWRDQYADGKKPNILLRFAHEFNGIWYPWSNQPETMKQAWRYLHSKFAAAGIGKTVQWVWCANNTDVDDVNDVMAYYPGDDVVDWLSIDGYNWGSNFSFTEWKSFDETFSEQYVKMVTAVPDKPMMIAEIGSAEPQDLPDPSWGQEGDDSDAQESKEAWVADMMRSIQSDYPAIRSLVWFNTNKELSWGLNLSGNTGLAAYNNAVTADYFSGTMSFAGEAETDAEPVSKGKGKGRKTKSTARVANATGLDRAAQVRRVPEVIGQGKLKKESEGLRNMPEHVLKQWKMKRLEQN